MTEENGTATVAEAVDTFNEDNLLDRDAILGMMDTTWEIVDVPEWHGKVKVRSLTGVERDKIEASMVQQRGKDSAMNLANLRAKVCAASIVGKNSERLFSDADIHALGRKNAAALDRVYTVAQRLSGITKEDAEAIAKNSESDQSDYSTSS